jgi:hypothetical protein
MAKKKRRIGELKRRGEATLKGLQVVEKEIGLVRENLRQFLAECNQFRSGPGYKQPTRTRFPPR